MESFRKLISKFRPESSRIDHRGEMTVHAVVTRADGTVEDLGLITKGHIRDWQTNNSIPSGGK